MKNFITVGTFDGVHLGHREILRALAREAGELGLKSCAAYFPVPPKAVLSGKTAQSMLTLPAERERLIFNCGVDHAAPVEFTKELANESPEKFFAEVIIGKLHAGGLLAGQDFAFGKNRAGHVNWLRQKCAEKNISLAVMHFVKSGGHKISSSAIRAFLHAGKVSEAAALLGRNYTAKGMVIKGEGVGRKLGFPTANLAVDERKILPRGVFDARARLDGREFCAVANVGFRPTVNPVHAAAPLCEVHILDFSRDIYGMELEVEFISLLRGETRFNSVAELTAAIRADIAAVRQKPACRTA